MKKISLKDFKDNLAKSVLTREQMKPSNGSYRTDCRRQSSNVVDLRPGANNFTESHFTVDYIVRCGWYNG
jgi:hypothetical protein